MSDDGSQIFPRIMKGRCPHCGEGKLFASWLQLNPICPACGADFKASENGDAPAVISIWVVGGLTTILATIAELVFAPPYWLHAVLWIPFTLFTSLLCLHYAKAWMLYATFRHEPRDELP